MFEMDSAHQKVLSMGEQTVGSSGLCSAPYEFITTRD